MSLFVNVVKITRENVHISHKQMVDSVSLRGSWYKRLLKFTVPIESLK